jgi:hypothetical protein
VTSIVTEELPWKANTSVTLKPMVYYRPSQKNFTNAYFIGHGIVLKGIVKYFGRGKNIPHTFGHTELGANTRKNSSIYKLVSVCI